MSAPEVVIGYIAAKTEHIHLGSAIINLSPPQGAPGAQRRARRDARPLHRATATSGAPAAAPAATRWPPSTSSTRTRPRPSGTRSSREIPRMWEQQRLHVRRRALHGADAAQHPPQALRQRPPADLGRLRQPAAPSPRPASSASAPSPSTSSRSTTCKGRIDAYKEGIANCTEPIGQFKNDNVMMTNAVICLRRPRAGPRDRHVARAAATSYTMVNLYHDTMPQVAGRRSRGRRPPMRSIAADRGAARQAHRGRLHALRHARRGAASRSRKYQATSAATSSCSASPIEGMEHDEVLEMLELFGDKVIPEFDKDPEHSTDHYREHRQAQVRRSSPTRCPTSTSSHARTALLPLPEARAGGVAPLRLPPVAHRPEPRAPRRHRHPQPRCSTRPSGCSPAAGVFQATIREIIEAAGQRNVSALNYHFGSREGVLDAILDPPRRPHRRRAGGAAGRASDATRRPRPVAALWCPTPATSTTPQRPRLPAHRRPARRPRSPRGGTVEHGHRTAPRRDPRRSSRSARTHVPEAPCRRERVVELIMLMTGDRAERARVHRAGRPDAELDHATFVANLTDVLVGVLEAPVGLAIPA